ncbi:hypothetical protein BDV93DRAFT_511074 [Ceratobasidium sp. AG-I]|nr:hypothetical protein BDV93DRAFT_511074 [Ceratobasidium sp. AG-I]
MFRARRSGFACGKAPFTSRNRAAATAPLVHASLTVFASKCNTSVVVRPDLPPKWWLGIRWCFSARALSLFATHADKDFDEMLRRAIGHFPQDRSSGGWVMYLQWSGDAWRANFKPAILICRPRESGTKSQSSFSSDGNYNPLRKQSSATMP